MESPPKDNVNPEHRTESLQTCSGLKYLDLQNTKPPCPPKKDLTTLPNEILSLIAACTTSVDLLAFRATNKQLHGNSIAAFVDRFIRKIHIMLTNKSLQALVGISQHEVFAPHVRAVGIDPAAFLTDHCMCNLSECDGCHTVPCSRGYDHFYSSNNDPGTETACNDGELVQKNADNRDDDCCCPLAKEWSCCQQQQEKPSVHDYLREAFTNFAKYGQSLCLSLEDCGIEPIGYRSYFRAHRHYFTRKMEHGVVFKELLETATSCSLNVQQLTIDVGDKDGHDDDICESGTLLLTTSETEYATRMLSRLQKINIKILANSLLCDILADSCYSLAKMLSVTNNLEVLTLDMDLKGAKCKDKNVEEMQDADPLGKLARSLTSSKLTELVLCDIYGHETDLRELLSKHSQSLKCLTLNCCYIWEGGSWSQLFSWMLENLRLEKLSVWGLMTHRGPVDQRFELDLDKCGEGQEAMGEKDVKELMRSLVKDLQSQ
ncbi:hypothetical protein BDV97DRAFT_405894 [Delphinella strobiligena]|nr:hypothetical protein BDV97DRAFT_405894 [Delphinella strobiligena]